MIKGDIKDVKDILEQLENMFTDRIKELHDVAGMQAHRHAFIYYREKILAALILLDRK
jgi:hypothetical protein